MEVLSGSVNKSGLFELSVTKAFQESTVSKILDLVQNAGSRKAQTEKFITRFAAIYTPIVVFMALGLSLIPPLVIQGATFSDWIYRALVFLVVSCPCALVISIPLGFFGGIGAASSHGVLVKGANFLEALNQVETVVFDKTGTLTKGVFHVTKIVSRDGLLEAQLIELTAYGEAYSSHPIGTSILKAYGEEINRSRISENEEIPGEGVRSIVDGKEVLIGNFRLMGVKGVEIPGDITEERFADEVGTIVHVAIDQRYAGYIVISDEIKEDAARAISELKRLGIRKIVMLTGDLRSTGHRIAERLGIDEVRAELMPHEKVEALEELERMSAEKGSIIFVGDGINDAPVLARADIGIAMGGVGSDAAIEAADIVLMTDEPYKIVTALQVARKTRHIVMQNIILAFAIKLLVLVLGAGGIATMWEAVFADVGVALLAVLNAMRLSASGK